MARDIESLVLRMSADLRRFEKEMARGRSVADRELNAIERKAVQSQRNLARSMEQAGSGMVSALRSSLSALAPTLAAAFSAGAVIQYADAWTAGRNALAAAGVATSDLAERQSQLVDLANETRTGAAETIALYQRLSIATSELGLNQQDTLRLTELLNKSFASSGLSTQEAASAALQLSQALASGSLQGDELRSIRENAPQVAIAIAESMGVGIGALKELGAEGKITADVIVQALYGASEQINATFDNTEMTVGQALSRLNNEIGRFVGEADASLSATDRLAQGIVALADNLDRIVPVAVALATVIGTGYAASLTVAGVQTTVAAVASARYQLALIGLAARQTGATTAQIALNAAMAANPIGLIVAIVAALAAGLFLLARRYSASAVAARELESATEAGNTALANYEKAQAAAQEASGKSAVAARNNAAAMREEAEAAIVAARALAAKRTAEAQANLQSASDAFREATSTQSRDPSEVAGQLAFAAGARSRFQSSQQAAAAAIREQIRQEQEFSRISAGINLGGRGGSASSPDKAAGKAGGADAADRIASAREALAIELDIARAKATGDAAAVRAAEERETLARLVQQYESAGYEDANALALEHLSLLNQSVLKAENLAGWIKQSDEFWEQIGDNAERAAASEQLLTDQTRDRLGFEAEIARLTGNEVAIRNAERRLFIEERALEIIRLKLAATKEEAELMAGAEFSALDNAERSGDLREEFRQSFSEGIRAAIEGDVGGFMENLADRFTDRMLNNLADDLFDLLSTAAKGFGAGQGGGGGGWLSAIASAFTGGRTAATGRSATAGFPVLVGERRPEVFVPNVSGSIIPNVNAAMAKAQGAGSRSQVVDYRMTINLAGANGDETIRRIAYDAAARGGQAAYQRARSDVPADLAQKRRYSR